MLPDEKGTWQDLILYRLETAKQLIILMCVFGWTAYVNDYCKADASVSQNPHSHIE